MTVVAAFDLDGTITARDCVVPFLRRVAGERRLVTTTASGVARSVACMPGGGLLGIAARSSMADTATRARGRAVGVGHTRNLTRDKCHTCLACVM